MEEVLTSLSQLVSGLRRPVWLGAPALSISCLNWRQRPQLPPALVVDDGCMHRTWLRRGSIALLLIVSVGPYLLVSLALNGQPSSRAFAGWLAVLQSASSRGDQVSLGVAALEPGAPDGNPNLLYTVAVCGDAPFDGKLLIGGHARLSRPQVTPDVTRVGRLSKLEFRDISSGQVLRFDDVDAIDLRFQISGSSQRRV